MNIIAWLRTPLATLIVLCSALVAQLPHAADVFRLIVMGDGPLAVAHSYTYAVALELAVLLFVVQRRNVESYIFAGVSILVNLSYYYLHGVALLSVAALPAWLVSIALPAAIAQYSHLIAAATEPYENKPVETPTTNVAPLKPAQAPVARPVGTLGHPDVTPPAEQTGETPVLAPPPELRAVAAKSDSDIAAMLGVKRQAVQGWRKRNTLEKNIAEKLPTVAAPHTNGYNHESEATQ
jgi:hypothetical protein